MQVMPWFSKTTMLFACAIGLASTRDTHAQVLQIIPSHHASRHSQPFLDACLHMDQWPTLYERTTYLGSDDGLDATDSSTLTTCFSQMKARDLQFTVQTGITGAFTTGQDAFNFNSPKWSRFIRLGAPLTVLLMDEPLYNGQAYQHLTYSTIVEETANWIALVRRAFPTLKLILIEPHPAESSTQIIDFVSDLNAGAAKRGVAGLDGLEIDHFWDGPRPWNGSDMADMRAAAHSRRMEFAIIFYAAMPFPNPTNDCDFLTRLYQQWNKYNAEGIDYYGFYPDIYTVESWDQIPSATVPEAIKACTFTQGARQWIDFIAPPLRPAAYSKRLIVPKPPATK